jgi:hypothetical protein
MTLALRRCDKCGGVCNAAYDRCAACDPHDRTRREPFPLYPFGVKPNGR